MPTWRLYFSFFVGTLPCRYDSKYFEKHFYLIFGIAICLFCSNSTTKRLN